MRGNFILNNIYPVVLDNILFNENNIIKILISNNLLNPILEFIQRLKLNYEKKTKGLQMCIPYINWVPNNHVDMCVMDNIYILQVLKESYIESNLDSNDKKFIKVYNIISNYIYNVKLNSAITKLGYNGKLYDFGDLVMKQDGLGLIRVELDPGSRIVYIPRVDKVMCNMCNPKNLATFQSMEFMQNTVQSLINIYIRTVTFNSIEVDLIVKSDSHKRWWDFLLRSMDVQSKYTLDNIGYNNTGEFSQGNTEDTNGIKEKIGPNDNFQILQELLIMTNTSPEKDYTYSYKCNIYFDSLFVYDINTDDNDIVVYNNYKNTSPDNRDYELFTNIILLSSNPITGTDLDLNITFFMDVTYIESDFTQSSKNTLTYSFNNISDGYSKQFNFNPKYHFNKYIKTLTKDILLNPFYIVELNLKDNNNNIFKKEKINLNIDKYTISSNLLDNIEIKIPYVYNGTELHFENSNEVSTTTTFIEDTNSNKKLAVATITNTDSRITGASSFYLQLNDTNKQLTSIKINFTVIDTVIKVRAVDNSSNIEEDVFYSHTGDLVSDISNMNDDISLPNNYSLKEINSKEISLYTNTEERIIPSDTVYTQSGSYDIYYGNPLRFIAKVNNGVNLAVSQFDLLGIDNTTVDTDPLLYYLDQSEINSLNIFSLLSLHKIKQLNTFTTLSLLNNLYINYKGPSDVYKLEASSDTHHFPDILVLKNNMEKYKFINTNSPNAFHTLKLIDIYTDEYILIKINYNSQIYLYPKAVPALSIVNADDIKEEAKMTTPNGSLELPDHGQYVGKTNRLNATFIDTTRPTSIKVKYYPNIPLEATINSQTTTNYKTQVALYSDSFDFTNLINVVFKATYPNAKDATFPISILYNPLPPISIKTVTLKYNVDPSIQGKISNNNITFNLTTEVQDKQGVFEFTFSNMTDTFNLTLDNKTTSFNKTDKHFQLTDQDINKNNKTLTIINSDFVINSYEFIFHFKNPTPTISPIITNITTNSYISMLKSFSKDILTYKAIINGPITSKFVIIITLDQAVSVDDIYIYDNVNDIFPKMINTSSPYREISFELDLSNTANNIIRSNYEIHMKNSFISPPIYNFEIVSDIQDIYIIAKFTYPVTTPEYHITSFFHVNKINYDLYYKIGPAQFDFKVTAENIDAITFKKTFNGQSIDIIGIKDTLNKTITFSYTNSKTIDQPILTISDINQNISYTYHCYPEYGKIVVHHLDYDHKYYGSIFQLINIFNDNWVQKSIVIYLENTTSQGNNLHNIPPDLYWYILKNSGDNVEFLDQNLTNPGKTTRPIDYDYQGLVSLLDITKTDPILSVLPLPPQLLQDDLSDYTFTLGFATEVIAPGTNVEDIPQFQNGVSDRVVNILQNKDITLRLTNKFTDEFYIEDLEAHPIIPWYNPTWKNIDPFTIIDLPLHPEYINTIGYLFLPQNVPTLGNPVFKLCTSEMILPGLENDLPIPTIVTPINYLIITEGVDGEMKSADKEPDLGIVINNYLTNPTKIDGYDYNKTYQIKINYKFQVGSNFQTTPVILGDISGSNVGIKPIPTITAIYFNTKVDAAPGEYVWGKPFTSSDIYIKSSIPRISGYVVIKYETNIPLSEASESWLKYDNYNNIDFTYVLGIYNSTYTIVKLKRNTPSISVFDPLTVLTSNTLLNPISFSYNIKFHYGDPPPTTFEIILQNIYHKLTYYPNAKTFKKGDTDIKLSDKSIIDNPDGNKYEITVTFDKSSGGKTLTKSTDTPIIDINNLLLINTNLKNKNIKSIDIHNITAQFTLKSIIPYYHSFSIKMGTTRLFTTADVYLFNNDNTSLILKINQPSITYSNISPNVPLTIEETNYIISELEYNKNPITDNSFKLLPGSYDLTFTFTPIQTHVYDYTINFTVTINYISESHALPIFSSFSTMTWLDYKNTVTFTHKSTLIQSTYKAPIFVADTPLSYITPNTHDSVDPFYPNLVKPPWNITTTKALYDVGISTPNYVKIGQPQNSWSLYYPYYYINLENNYLKTGSDYNFSSIFFETACNNNPNIKDITPPINVCMSSNPNNRQVEFDEGIYHPQIQKFKMQFNPHITYSKPINGYGNIVFIIDPFYNDGEGIKYLKNGNYSLLTNDHVKNSWHRATNQEFTLGNNSKLTVIPDDWENTTFTDSLTSTFCIGDSTPPVPYMDIEGYNIHNNNDYDPSVKLIQNWLGDLDPEMINIDMENARWCLVVATDDPWPVSSEHIFKPIPPPPAPNPDQNADLNAIITWENVLTNLKEHNPDDITRSYQIYAYKETLDKQINIPATLITFGTMVSTMNNLFLTEISNYNSKSYITNINKANLNNDASPPKAIPKAQELKFNTKSPYEMSTSDEIKKTIFTINDTDSNFNNVKPDNIDDIINNDIFLPGSEIHDDVTQDPESIFYGKSVPKSGSYVTSSSIKISASDVMGGGRIYISQNHISFDYVTGNTSEIHPLRVLNKTDIVDFIEFTITGTSIFCNTSNVDSINNVYQFQGIGWNNKIFTGDEEYKNNWNIMGFEPTLFSNDTMIDWIKKPSHGLSDIQGLMEKFRFYNETSNNINNYSLFTLHTDIFKFTLLKDILAGSGVTDFRDMGGYNIIFPSPNTILSNWVANPTLGVNGIPVLKNAENITKMQNMAKLYIPFLDVYTEICEEVQYKTIESSQGGTGTSDIYNIAKLDTIGNYTNINNWFGNYLPPIEYWEKIGFNMVNKNHDPSNRQFLFYSKDIINDKNIVYIINQTKLNIPYISVILPSDLKTQIQPTSRIIETTWSEYRIDLKQGASLFDCTWLECKMGGLPSIPYSITDMINVKKNMVYFFSRHYCSDYNKAMKNIDTIPDPDSNIYKIKSFMGIVLGVSSPPEYNLLSFVFDYVSKRGSTFEANNAQINNMNLQAGLYGTYKTKLIKNNPPKQPFFHSTGYIDLTSTLGLSAYAGMGLYQADSPGKIGAASLPLIITFDGALRTAVIASYCRGTIHQHLAEPGDKYFFNPSNFYCVNQKLNKEILTDTSPNLYPSTVPDNIYDSSAILSNQGFYTDTNSKVSNWNYTLLYAGFTHLISTQPYQKSYAMAYDDFGGGFAPTIDYNPKYLNYLDMSQHNGDKSNYPT